MVKQTVFRQTRNQIEFDKYIAPDGDEYSFDNAYDRFIWGRSGDGMPSITYRTERGPFQDGVTPLGFVLNPRIVQLIHRRNADCRSDYWDNRADIMNSLRPNRQPTSIFQGGVLRKERPDGSQRDLCVLIERGPDFRGSSGDEWDEWSIQEVIRFVAHDPLYFDPNENIGELLIDTIDGDELEFPITFPISFSTSQFTPNNQITYNGTFASFPQILLFGPMESIVIGNVTTQEYLILDTIIASNRVVTINLLFGGKAIVDDLGNNLIGSLNTASDLATFHLEPTPLAVNGVNDISVVAAGIDANTRVVFRWFDRYIGI